jgi:hypothetical protein
MQQTQKVCEVFLSKAVKPYQLAAGERIELMSGFPNKKEIWDLDSSGRRGCFTGVRTFNGTEHFCFVLDLLINLDPNQYEVQTAKVLHINHQQVLVFPLDSIGLSVQIDLCHEEKFESLTPQAMVMCKLPSCSAVRQRCDVVSTCEHHFMCGGHLIPWDQKKNGPDLKAARSHIEECYKFVKRNSLVDDCFLQTRALMSFHSTHMLGNREKHRDTLVEALTSCSWHCEVCASPEVAQLRMEGAFSVQQIHKEFFGLTFDFKSSALLPIGYEMTSSLRSQGISSRDIGSALHGHAFDEIARMDQEQVSPHLRPPPSPLPLLLCSRISLSAWCSPALLHYHECLAFLLLLPFFH